MLRQQKKITKKELKRDPLLEKVHDLRMWWRGNSAAVNKYGSIALVVAVLSILVINWRANEDQKAAGVAGVAILEYGAKNYASVIDKLAPVVEEYSGLKSFGNGLYILAHSEYLTGDTAAAEEHYKRYLDDYNDDDMLVAAANIAIATILEANGDLEGAAIRYRKAAKIASSTSLKHQYTIYAGRAYLLLNQHSEAIKLLEEILQDENLSFQLRNEAQSLLASAQVKAGIKPGA